MITLEAYECWHGAMAGIVKAENGGWHKMDVVTHEVMKTLFPKRKF